jgi:uncharacterized protein
MNNVEIVRGLYEAFAKGDVPAVLAGLDAQVDWREAENFIYADGNPYVGPAAVLEGIFMRLGGEWEYFKAVPAEFHGDGATVFVQGRYDGVYRATGRKADAQFMHVWTLGDGKVTKFRQYTDTLQVARVTSA